MTRALAWFKRWGAFVLLGLGLVIGWFVSRKRPAPIPEIRDALKLIDTEKKVEKLLAEKKAEDAIKVVEAQHKDALDALAGAEKEEADALRDDPMALAQYLSRAGSRARAR